MARLSQHSNNRTHKRGRGIKFNPDPAEFRKVCGLSPYNTSLMKHFGIGVETFYSFIDKERYKEEKDLNYKSDFLDALKTERMRFKKLISDSFYNKIAEGDTASIIFGMKLYNGAMEEKDLKTLALKRKEFILKSKQYLTDLAKKFDLNYEQLCEFSNKYFTDIKD